MDQVSLRDYCDEARSFIQSGEFDRAINITRHVLSQYPHHIESYRLLGEALLEAGNCQDAAKQFRRVLGADPEDTASRIGLIRAYEATGDLNRAAWQARRALDLSPADPDIRQQLHQLIGTLQNDSAGESETTRVALGHIYARGGLYAKAVQEFKAALAQEPERFDVQVALAEALWRAGQNLEASEVCHYILEKHPYAVKANLIIGAIWLDSRQPDKAESCFRVAQALDPENIVAQSLFGEKSPLSPCTIMLERPGEFEMEYMQPAPPSTPPAESVSPLRESEPAMGRMSELHEEEITPMNDEERPEEDLELPDWLQGVGDDLLEEDVQTTSTPPAGSSVEEDETLDWLRGLVSHTSESAQDSDEGPVESSPAKDTRDQAEVPGIPAESDGIPDWLQELRPEALEMPGETPAVSDTPDWLSAVAEGRPLDDIQPEAAPGATESPQKPTAPEAGLPDRLSEGEKTEADFVSPEAVGESEEPALSLQTAGEEVEAPSASDEKTGPSMLEPIGGIVEESEVPDWLREIAAGEPAPPETAEPDATAFPDSAEEQVESQVQPVSPEAAGADEGRALWEQILAEEGVDLTLAEEARPPEAEGMTAEDWLRSTADVSRTQPTKTPPEPAVELPSAEAEVPDWLAEVQESPDLARPTAEAAGQPAGEVEVDEMLDWLRELEEPALDVEPTTETKGEAEAEALKAVDAEIDEAGLPDWLREPVSEAVEAPEGEVDSAAEVPDWLKDLESEETPLAEATFEEPIELETGEMPDWLGEVMTKETLLTEGLGGPEATLQAEEEETEAPDWLREFQDEEKEIAPEPAAEAVELVAPTEIEEYPSEPGEDARVAEEEVEAPPELPDWLRRLREGVPEDAIPTPAERPPDLGQVPEVSKAEKEIAPVEVPAEPEVISAEVEGPEWLGELVRDEESLAELEAITEEIAAERAVSMPAEHVEAKEAEAPFAAPPEVAEVEAPPVVLPEARPEAVETLEPAAPPPAETRTTRRLEPLRVEDLPKDPAARLTMARAALNAGDWPDALLVYETLVNSSQLLDSVIDDLKAGIRRRPDDAAAYQLLGDACMKDGRLQDALRTYRTALTKL